MAISISAWERFRPEFARAARAYQLVDHLSLRTDHDWLDEVVHFIARRRHRLRQAS